MERRRPARISVAYETSVTNVGSKRNKMLIAVIFAAFAAGVGQAFLRYKMDRSLRTPEDMVREVGPADYWYDDESAQGESEGFAGAVRV